MRSNHGHIYRQQQGCTQYPLAASVSAAVAPSYRLPNNTSLVAHNSYGGLGERGDCFLSSDRPRSSAATLTLASHPWNGYARTEQMHSTQLLVHAERLPYQPGHHFLPSATWEPARRPPGWAGPPSRPDVPYLAPGPAYTGWPPLPAELLTDALGGDKAEDPFHEDWEQSRLELGRVACSPISPDET
jgi:hypothetical protein